MGAFLNPLDVKLIDEHSNAGRGTWMVTSPLRYISSKTCTTYTVPSGFTTDFITVPRLPFIFDVFGDIAHRATVLHDWLYTYKVVSRQQADDILFEAMRSTKVGCWKCWVIYLAVRMFGAKHYGRP